VISLSTEEDARAQARLATIREEISTRLWPVNAGMSSRDFNELMDQMALLQFSFEYRAGKTPSVDRRLGVGERRSDDEAVEPPTDPIP
jgi:hypothetical protein